MTLHKLESYRESVFASYVDQVMAVHGARGVAVAVFDRFGRVRFERFWGWRDVEKKLPIDRNTVFGIASLTKSFTALSIMQLADRGLVDIDELASAYLPELRRNEFKGIRLWHLLSHSAGFFPLHRTTVQEVAEKEGLWQKRDVTELACSREMEEKGFAAVIAGMSSQKKRLGLPGRFMSYCNDGYSILSEIISRKGEAGSYADWLDINIFKPLGMIRSFCGFLRAEKEQNVSTLYSDLDGSGIKGHHDFYAHAFATMGGGAIKSTLHDLCGYVRTLMNGGLSPEGLRIVSGNGIDEMIRPRVPSRHQMFYNCGLMTSFLDDVTIIKHGGSLPGVSSALGWSPELGMGAVVLCNTSDVPVDLIFTAAMRWAAGKNPLPGDPWTTRPWGEETIALACGAYKSEEEGDVVEIRSQDDGIVVSISGRKLDVRMVEPDTALLRSGLSERELRLMFDAEGVWGVRLGDRIIPRLP